MAASARAAAVVASVAAIPAAAWAQEGSIETKVHCVSAAEQSQRLSARGLLVEARAVLRTCAQDTCPDAVRIDCQRWLADLERSIPSIMVRVRDDSEREVHDAIVTIDGALAGSDFDASPIELDPGEHVVRVGPPSRLLATEHLFLRAGDPIRSITIHLSATPPPPALAPAPAPSAVPAVREPLPAIPAPWARPIAWTAAGLGAVGLGSFAYFGATGKSELDRLRSQCAGHCTQSDVDAAWRKLIVADASLGVAAAASAIALWLFLAPPSSGRGARTADVVDFGVYVDSRGGGVDCRGAF
jgi:hypothetical protein